MSYIYSTLKTYSKYGIEWAYFIAGRSSGSEGEEARERSVSSSIGFSFSLPSSSRMDMSVLARLSTSPSSIKLEET